MKYNTDDLGNEDLRYMTSQGYSSLRISKYHSNLVLDFAPYIGRDKYGGFDFDWKGHKSTSITYEKAACFFHVIQQVIRGEIKESKLEVQCYHDAFLTFEFKPDDKGNTEAILTIYKHHVKIPFKFSTEDYEIIQDGRQVIKVVQTGLISFSFVLVMFLMYAGVDLFASRHQPLGHMGRMRQEGRSGFPDSKYS